MRGAAGIALVLALAAALRFSALATPGLWLDEVWSVSLAQRGIVSIVDAMSKDPHPPLHTLLLAGALRAPISVELAARGVSALAGVITVWLVWIAAGRGRRALAAAALVAVLPLHVQFSREARSYALVCALVTAGNLVAVRAFARGRASAAELAIWTLCGVATVWTHYVAAAAVPLQALLLACAGGRAGAGRALGALACVAAGCLPLLEPLCAMRPTDAFWIPRPAAMDLVRAPAQLVGPAATTVGGALAQVIVGLAVWSGLARTLTRAARRAGGADAAERAHVAWALLAVGAMAALYAVSVLAKPLWQVKQLLFAAPALVLWLCGLAAPARAAAVALAAVLVADGLACARTDEAWKDQDRRVARALVEAVPEGTRVYVWPGYQALSLTWHLRHLTDRPVDVAASRGQSADMAMAPAGAPLWWVYYPGMPSPDAAWDRGRVPGVSPVATVIGAEILKR